MLRQRRTLALVRRVDGFVSRTAAFRCHLRHRSSATGFVAPAAAGRCGFDTRVAFTSRLEGGGIVELSARNQLKGTVRSVKLGTIMAEVVVDVGGQEVVAAITKSSAERLGLEEGAEVTVLIKATEVMIATGS